MIITWYGQSCVRLASKESALVVDPYNASIGLRLPRLNASVVCVTHDHDDHNNVKAVSGDPFVITTPGEYEIGGVFIHGMDSFHDAREGKDRGRTIIFDIEMEGIQCVHLGDLGTTELSKEQLERVEGADVLFVPIGGTYTIDGKQAEKVIQAIEPRIVIPIHYKIPKLKIKLDGPETFLKAYGAKSQTPEDQLKITKKDLPQEATKIILLSPRA